MLLGSWVSMTVAYYFAFFFIRDLEGGLFVNTVILGSAEVFANFASGFLMLILHEDLAYKVCSTIALVFNLLLPFLTNSYLRFLCLFLAIGGLGGMDNTIYLVIEMQVCPTDIGGTMQLLAVSAAVVSSSVSLLATLPQPYPIFITAALCIISAVFCHMLPEGGRFFPSETQEKEIVSYEIITNTKSPRENTRVVDIKKMELADITLSPVSMKSRRSYGTKAPPSKQQSI